MRARCAIIVRLLAGACGMACAAVAHAEPVPAITPFEGAWVPKGETASCDGAGSGGDGILIEGRTIGSGDTVCTMQDMTVTKHIYYIRMNCHGLNRSFAGTKLIRIDRLGPNRMLFRHQGEAPSEMERCR
jgi:hypothetical protein